MSDLATPPAPAPQYQFAWTQASTVASLAGIVALFVTIGTLIIDRIRRGKLSDPQHFLTRRWDMGYFWVDEPGAWAAFWKKRTKTPKLTTIRGLIEAGDRNLWSSAALDQLEQYHGEVSWTPIYSAIFSQIANDRNIKLELDKDIDFHGKNYLERVLEDSGTEGDRGQYRRKLIADGILIACIRPLDQPQEASKNLIEVEPPPPQSSSSSSSSRSWPTETTYQVQSLEKSLRNSDYIWMRSGRPCIETSREELLALALILGITLHINNYTQNIRGLGPFGTGLNVVEDNGEWKLELVHGTRLKRHRASRGSGYTSLFAKHIAFGSLPFAETEGWIRSVYVSRAALEAIRRGDSVVDGFSFGGRPLQILRRLPGSKEVDAYYHISAAKDLKLDPGFEHQVGRFYRSDRKSPIILQQRAVPPYDVPATAIPLEKTPSPTINIILGTQAAPQAKEVQASITPVPVKEETQANSNAIQDEEEKIYANWSRAVTGIAFGGLVPQSSHFLARAVEFTVSDCDDDHDHQKEVEHLINKIEDLINQIQAWDCRNVVQDQRVLETSERSFGDYVAERAPSEGNVDNVYYAIPLKYNDTQEAAASFARYMNLLERMVGLLDLRGLEKSVTNGSQEKSIPIKVGPVGIMPRWKAYLRRVWHARSLKLPPVPEREAQMPEYSAKVDIVFEESCKEIQKAYVTATKRYSQARQPKPKLATNSEISSSHQGSAHNTTNERVKAISNKISRARQRFLKGQKTTRQDGKPPFTITIQDCVLIVRCILIIWSNQVPKIHNEDTDERDPEELADGGRGGGGEGSMVREAGIPSTTKLAGLMDLPQVMAFA